MTKLTIGNTSYRYYVESDLEGIAKLEEMCINPPWSYNALCEFTK